MVILVKQAEACYNDCGAPPHTGPYGGLYTDTEWSESGISEIKQETQLFVRPVLGHTGHKVSNTTWVKKQVQEDRN